MGKRRLSVLLMVLSILAILSFQGFWIYKNYREEQRLFTMRTTMLFRESVMKLQASKLHLDTNYNISIEDRSGIISMTNELKTQFRKAVDTALIEKHPSMIVSMHHTGPDTLHEAIKVFYRRPNEKVVDFLVGVDSLLDSIPLPEIRTQYEKELASQGLSASFNITVKNDEGGNEIPLADTMDNQVAIGFTHPRIYQIEFINPFWIVVKKIASQIVLSILLVGITVISFLLLFRNWQRQRKLTQLKNDFISNITHELKTPLATVSVAIEALRNFNAIDDPKKTSEYLSISANELQRLSLLVDKVLKLSLFEKHEIELKKELFDMKGLVTDVIASMKLQFEKYGALISFSATGNDFRLHADKMHMTSVLFNLLDNALKYSVIHPSIQVELADQHEVLQLSVTDNGIGIPQEYRDKVFEKFFRVPTGDRHNVKGYGLGLSYCAYVVQRQGGTIHVQSTEGIGSRFVIKIPKSNG